MILDHKKRFKESLHHKHWHEATASDWFQAGLQTSLLEALDMLPQSGDMGAAAANEFRRQGARLLVRTMLNITEVQVGQKTRYDQNLNFEA